jgi:hypothetical protein
MGTRHHPTPDGDIEEIFRETSTLDPRRRPVRRDDVWHSRALKMASGDDAEEMVTSVDVSDVEVGPMPAEIATEAERHEEL